MTIATSDVAIGTVISVTGGTATSMISKGDSLEKHNLVLDDGSAFSDQKALSFSVKEPKVSANAPGGYTQARNFVLITIPMTLANGNVTKNTVRLEMSVDSETTTAQKDALREIAAQVMFDTDFDQFWHSQAVS